MYKISVTTLEKFRRFMADTSSYDTEQSLLESLQGLFTGNEKTRFGSAFHELIEHPALFAKMKGGHVIIEVDGYNIAVPENIALEAIKYKSEHPLMICEVPVSKKYNTAFGEIFVSGRVDGIEGVQVRDGKTKYRAQDVLEYMESCQWKFYLDILGLRLFHYDVFEIKFFDGLQPEVEKDGTTVYYPIITKGRDRKERPLGIVYHEPIPCYSYLGMQEYCRRLVSDFMEWVEFRGLFHLLKKVDANGHTIKALSA